LVLRVDKPPRTAKLSLMEVNLHPETESRLQELAQKTGRTAAALIADATALYLKELGELRIAQYNALTTRITYYVTLQYATWGAAAALSGYLATLWSAPTNHQNFDPTNRQNLEWITLVCLLTVIWAVLHINYEMFVIVLYLKEELLKNLATDFEGWIRKLGWVEDLHRIHAATIIFAIGLAVLVWLLCQDLRPCDWVTWWLAVSVSLALIVGVKLWRIGALNKRLKK
jgi:predicted DNA-binding protein